jgi:hypothetical protein
MTAAIGFLVHLATELIVTLTRTSTPGDIKKFDGAAVKGLVEEVRFVREKFEFLD